MPTFKFEFSPHAERDFSSLPKNLQKRILKKLDYFEESGHPLTFAKPMIDFNKYYRFRIGDYRVIVTPKKNGKLSVLLILRIGHRREVYKLG